MTQLITKINIAHLASLAKIPKKELPISSLKNKSAPLPFDAEKRESVIRALFRVRNFCTEELGRGTLIFNEKMLNIGLQFANLSLHHLKQNQNEDDILLENFLDEYKYILKNLRMIDVEKVSDAIPFWKTGASRAEFRRSANVSVGGKAHPTFLLFLLPRTLQEL